MSSLNFCFMWNETECFFGTLNATSFSEQASCEKFLTNSNDRCKSCIFSHGRLLLPLPTCPSQMFDTDCRLLHGAFPNSPTFSIYETVSTRRQATYILIHPKDSLPLGGKRFCVRNGLVCPAGGQFDIQVFLPDRHFCCSQKQKFLRSNSCCTRVSQISSTGDL